MASQRQQGLSVVVQQVYSVRKKAFCRQERGVPALGMRMVLFSLVVCISACIGTIGISKQASAKALPSHLTQQQSATINWDQFGYQNTRYNSSEKTLNASNVSRLTPKWSTYVGDVVNSSPAVVNGIVYSGSYDGYMKAFNDSTGTLLWRYQLPP